MEACYYCKKLILENDAFTRDTLDEKYKQTYHLDCFKNRVLNLEVIKTKQNNNNRKRNKIYDWILIGLVIAFVIEIIIIIILLII